MGDKQLIAEERNPYTPGEGANDQRGHCADQYIRKALPCSWEGECFLVKVTGKPIPPGRGRQYGLLVWLGFCFLRQGFVHPDVASDSVSSQG